MTDYLQPAPEGFPVRYPTVKVKLVGKDGNAFAILGLMKERMRRAKISPQEIERFMQEATSGDYHHLLATCQQWVWVS